MKVPLAFVAGIVVAAAVGYQAGSSSKSENVSPAPPATLTAVPTTGSSTVTILRVTLGLSEGQSSAEWNFDAPNPRSMGFKVAVTVRPRTAVVALAARATGGRALNVGRTDDNKSCQRNEDGNIAVCQFDLGVLDAEKPGTWVLMLQKESTNAASVDTDVSFYQP